MEATSTVSPVRPANSRTILKVVIAILIALLIVFLVFDFWFYQAIRAAMPVVDGTMQLGELTGPVIVTRNAQGVPTISAGNLDNLFYAQGYVTAQDRLWQMDMTRRYASGDLAEILGESYVKVDREQRILGLRQVAEKIVANMAPTQRAQFEAYARGVNAYIKQHHKTLPLEFRFLVYFPHVWTVEDSVLVGLSMTQFLNHGMYKDELEKEKVLAKVGPELMADLYVNSSWRDHPPGAESSKIGNEEQDGTGSEEDEESPGVKGGGSSSPRGTTTRPMEPQIPRGLRPARDASNGGTSISQVLTAGLKALEVISGSEAVPIRDFLEGREGSEERLHPGSNNWVVSGAHTASGEPLLSNDMHLNLQLPNTWYEAHLTAADFDVAGVTLPGVPYVIVGHNRNIAWGFTNLGPNVEDVYVEKFNDKGEYLTPQGWRQPERRKEIIRVKGKPEVNLDVEVTRHGPIITDVVPGESRKLALKWVVYDPQAGKIPFFEVNSAANWQQFREAFSQFGGPGQNVVYADKEGHIGYQATGLIPTRAAGDGSVPVPGNDDAHEWTGYVPYDKLPSVYDPPSGIIATANGRITAKGYPFLLSIEWGSPYRTERIYKLLSVPGKKFTSADMLTIQTDIVSEMDRYCAERFVYAIDHAAKASARARGAAELMRNWKGKMETDSAAPTVEFYSRRKLNELLLKPKLGDDWKSYDWFMSPVWLETVLMHRPARWLPPGYNNFDDVLTAAVEAAVSYRETPKALGLWRWGRVHRVDIEHPFWSHVPILKRAAGTGPKPLSGDGETIKQVGAHFGPSERLTVDFSDFDRTTLDVVNGQSGNVFDDHFNDQWDAYYNGRTFTLPFSSEAVQQSAVHHLRLQP